MAQTPAFVQVNSAVPQTPQTTVTVQYASAQSAGDLNVVAVGWSDTTAHVLTVTDTKGNAYAIAVGPTSSSGSGTQALYYAQNIQAAAANGNAVTVTFDSAATYPDIRIAEYKGIAVANALDVAVGATGSSGTASSGTVATTNASDLLIGASYVKTLTTGAGSSFTKRVITSPDGDLLEDRNVTAVGSYSATAPVSPTGSWVMHLVAFRSAGSGGGTAPAITSLNPASAVVGTSVTITGTNFGASQGTSTVKFNGTTATPGSWNATTIVVPVPTGATTGPVVVTVNGVASAGVTFTVLVPPSISTLNPASAAIGASVTISGSNFGATKGTSTVKFNGTTATPASWSATSIVAPVPSGATTGPVVVTVGTLVSNGAAFTVTPPTNQPPVVNAGADKVITLPTSSVTLSGTATDDGLPNPPGALTYGWSVVSGPGTVSFSAPTALTTSATFSSTGAYTLRLTVSDSQLVTTDDVVVTVNPTPTNQPPVVSAGPDQTITLPTTSASLTGTASDDGLPNPPAALTYAWSMVSGPGTVTFSAPTALATTATFSATGSYTLRLTVSDSLLTTTDDVVITVNPAPPFPPVLINSGGPSYTDSTGQVWAADKNFSGGGTYSTTAAIGGTPDPTLYKSERYGNFSYNVTVPNGTYAVTLYFAEIYWTSAGKRVFNVTIEGQPALQSFDIWAAAGANNATARTFNTTVTNGVLTISFVTVVDNAKVSAIQIAAISPINQAPTVNAGPDQITSLNAGVTLNGTASDDGLPAPPSALTYAWSVVSGPGNVTFSAPTALTTNATFDTAGTYTLRLTVSDSALTSTDDVIVTVLPPDTQAPSVPTNLAGIAISTTQVSLTWTASTDNVAVAGYRIYRNGAAVGTSPTNSYADSKLTNNTTYSYAVTAYDAAGNESAQSGSVNVTTPLTPPGPAYPLKVSANGRYLVDQNNTPFLLTGDSPWSLVGNLSEAQATSYFADRQAHGFNAVLISALCDPYTGCSNSEVTYDGIAAFTAPGNLSTPNPAYFQRLADMINLAAQAGLTVFLDPIETGDLLPLLRSNGQTVDYNYGYYLGNRYKNFANIVWISGNDFQTWTTASDDALVVAVANGIKAADPNHLQTVELNYSKSSSLDDPNWAPIVGLNAAYTYFPTYDEVLHAYNQSSTKPTYLVEAHYELENVDGEYGSPRVLRAQEYWTMLSGATGHLYGNGYIWPFKSGWQQNLDTPGVAQIGYLNALFQTRRWYDLIPDQTHSLVTAGYGTYDAADLGVNATNNYVTAAKTADGALAIAYIPGGQTVTIAMGNMSGPTTARWYDPSSGTFVAIPGSPFPNNGSWQFTPPGPTSDGYNDWVLLLEVTP
jgi:hypothetical protein